MSEGIEQSDCGNYRYRVWRSLRHEPWEPAWRASFIVLNPSPGEVDDDPIFQRCLEYARSWGAARVDVSYLFSLVTGNPRDLDVGRRCDAEDPHDARLIPVLNELCQPPEKARNMGLLRKGLVVCAWGDDGKLCDRGDSALAVVRRNGRPFFFGLTKNGNPRNMLQAVPGMHPEEWHR